MRLHSLLKSNSLLEIAKSISTTQTKSHITEDNLRNCFVFLLMFKNRFFSSSNCQLTSLVMYSLSQKGSHLIISVNSSDDGVEAHSWVETKALSYSERVDMTTYKQIHSIQKQL